MKITRSHINQIAGELWRNDKEYEQNGGAELLKKFQAAAKVCGPKLHDSTNVELSDEETETVNGIKKKLNLK